MQYGNEMNPQENTMFDMRKTGAIISAQRRKADLTQAELAEKLGISYQAVSSWERGASMPDIGKLVDLARLLGVTVDYLLSGEEPQTPEKEETVEAAPPVPQEEASMPRQEAHAPASLSALTSLAPFLDQETLDKAALEASVDDPALLCSLAPFLSSRTLGELALRNDHAPVNASVLCDLAPFLPHEALDALAERCEPTGDAALLSAIAPFLSKQTVSRLFSRAQAARVQEQRASAPRPDDPIQRMIDGADGEDIPALAGTLLPRLNETHITQLIEACDADAIAELAETLTDRLTDAQIGMLIEACDPDDIPKLAKTLLNRLNDSQIGMLIDACDSDAMLDLVRILSPRLSRTEAGNILKRLDS